LDGKSTAADDATWDNASPEQIKAQFERLSKTEQQRDDAATSKRELDVWVKTKPEYKDHPSNARQLLNQCKTLFGTLTPSMWQAEEAYQSLAGTGLLDINQEQLARQQEKRDEKQAQDILEAGGVFVYGQPTEAEMYEMPLDELRRRSNGVGR
jgi:hypothetical protein